MLHDPDAFACLTRRMSRPPRVAPAVELPSVAELLARLERAERGWGAPTAKPPA